MLQQVLEQLVQPLLRELAKTVLLFLAFVTSFLFDELCTYIVTNNFLYYL